MVRIVKKQILFVRYRVKIHNKLNAGFTLIELLATIAILALFYGLVMANFASWRGPQYIKVSANELATNINKVHSSALSAKSLNGNPVKLYSLEFSKSNPVNYKIQGLEVTDMGNVFRDPIETIVLPGAVAIQDITLTDKDGVVTHPDCLQLAFTLPFGQAYMNSACDFNSAKTDSALANLANAQLAVRLARTGTTTTASVLVDGITGRVTIQ